MLRFTRMALGLVLILAMTGREAQAQWGYGGWGYGGWGEEAPRPERRARGAGYYAMGAGVYNYQTAMANNINAQTAIMMNNAWAQATHEDAMIHAARVHKEFLRDQSLYDAHQKKLRDNPGQYEIENGDALNAAVMDLSDPRLGSTASRAANATVPASLIAEVPFQNASERVTFVLDKLRAPRNGPGPSRLRDSPRTRTSITKSSNGSVGRTWRATSRPRPSLRRRHSWRISAPNSWPSRSKMRTTSSRPSNS